MSNNKTIVLITGANQGIGYETAATLAHASPHYHILLGSRSLSKGESALATLQAQSPAATLSLVQLDVTDAASIAAAAAQVTTEHGRLDVLINNAGIVSSTTPFTAQLRSTLETNLVGAAAVTDAFQPLLLRAASPPAAAPRRLIYVTSDLGSLTLRADPAGQHYGLDATAYRVAKAGLNMLMLCQHVALADQGVRVFAFNPGFVVTNLTGEQDRENRVKRGAGDPRESARALAAIVAGERDAEAGKVVEQDGVLPW